MAKITIQNIVSTITLDHELDLERIRRACAEECFFETLTDRKYTFRVVALRIPKPKMTLLIYKTGKVICTGAKTIKNAQQCTKQLAQRLRKAGYSPPRKTKAKIQNIVATIDLEKPIDVEKLVDDLKDEKHFQTIYEPEQFPGAMVKLPIAQDSEATLLVFASGKIVSTGVKTYSGIQKAATLFTSRLHFHAPKKQLPQAF